MRRVLKGSLLAVLALLALLQVIRPRRSNPPVDPAREITAVHPTTSAVSSVLQRSCDDCHSNRTIWPWYSKVAPASWLVARDVNNGRNALNFSEWGAYQAEKRQELAGKICEEVKDREMPMPQYTFLHPPARLNSSEMQALCSWAQRIAPGTTDAERGDD